MTAATDIQVDRAALHLDPEDHSIRLVVSTGSKQYEVIIIGAELAATIDDYDAGWDGNGEAIAEEGSTLISLLATIEEVTP